MRLETRNPTVAPLQVPRGGRIPGAGDATVALQNVQWENMIRFCDYQFYSLHSPLAVLLLLCPFFVHLVGIHSENKHILKLELGEGEGTDGAEGGAT